MANNILQELSKDNILSVIPLAEKYFETKTGSNSNTLNILIAVQALAFKKCLFSGDNGPDLVQGVFKLSKMCCENLSKGWNCDLFKCINCIYNIINFLLNQGFAPQAKEMASILRDLKSKRGKELSSKDKDMIKNITSVFTSYIEKLIVKSHTFCQQEKMLMINWWKFIFSLSELNDFHSMKSFFHLSSALLSKPGLVDTNGDLWNLFFERCENWLNICKMKQENIQFSSNEFSLVLYMFDAYLSSCKLPEISTLNFSRAINILRTLSLSLKLKDVQLYNQITILISAMKAFESFQKLDSMSDFKLIPQSLKVNTSCCLELFKFVSNFFFNFSNLISKEAEIKNRSDVKYLIESILATFNCCLSSMAVNSNCLDNITVHVRFIRAALILINSSSAETIKLLYGRISQLFEGLFQIPHVGEVGGKYFYRCVTDCIMTIYTLFKASMYSYSYFLCFSFLKKIVEVKLPEPIPNYFSDDMHRLLNYLVLSAAESSYRFEALVCLLALTNQENIFKVDVFKYWCRLKLIPDSKDQMETLTVYDLIACDENVTLLEQTMSVDLFQWPNSVVKMLDFENLLLREIQCYSKQKELFKTASLAVYKVSAKRVSNKLILARILCCTVDVVSIDCETVPDISNFVLSLNNMKSLCDKNNNNSEYQLIRGDLCYQLARCELLNLRKAASVTCQTLLLENQEKDIPIVEEESNRCNIFSSLSFLEVNKLLPVLGHLDDAFNCWKKGFTGIANRVLNEESALSSIRFMKGVAYLYRLLAFQEKEILVWEFLFSQAQSLKNEMYQIIAVAELCVLKRTVNQEWITAVENILETNNSYSNSYFYYLYKINRAKNLYFTKQFQACYEIFSTLTENKFTHLRLIRAQYVQLEYMLSVCSEMREQLLTKTLPGSLRKAWEIAFISVNKAVSFSEKCAAQSVYLDLTLELSQGYCDSLDVAQCRTFTRWTLKESLRLFLAVRSCRLMCALADGDRLCCDSQQVDRRLNCLDTVLGVHQLEEECLPSRSTSPSLPYKYPLLEHPATCACPVCSHLEISFLILDSIRLKASYYSSIQKWTESKICFKNGFDVLSKIKKRINKEYLNFYIENELRFYVAATESLMLWNKTEKALAYSEYALKLQKCLLVPKKHLSTIVWMEKNFNCHNKNVGMTSFAVSYAPVIQKKAEFQQGQALTPVNDVNAVVPANAPKKGKCQGVYSLDISPHPFGEAHKKLFKSEIKEKKSDTVCGLETGMNQLTVKGGLTLDAEDHSETTVGQNEPQNENNINAANNLANVEHQSSKPSNYPIYGKSTSKSHQRKNVEQLSNKMTSSNIKTPNKLTTSEKPEIIVTNCDNETIKIRSSKLIKKCKTPHKSSSKSAFSVFCDEAKDKNPREKITGKKKLLFSTEEEEHEVKVTNLFSDFNVDIVSNLDVSDISIIDTSVSIEHNNRLIVSPCQSQGTVQQNGNKSDWRVNKTDAVKIYSKAPKQEIDDELESRITGLCLIDLEDDNKPKRRNLRSKQAIGDSQTASDVCTVPSLTSRRKLNPQEMLTCTPGPARSTTKHNLLTPTSIPTSRAVRSCRKQRL